MKKFQSPLKQLTLWPDSEGTPVDVPEQNAKALISSPVAASAYEAIHLKQKFSARDWAILNQKLNNNEPL